MNLFKLAFVFGGHSGDGTGHGVDAGHDDARISGIAVAASEPRCDERDGHVGT